LIYFKQDSRLFDQYPRESVRHDSAATVIPQITFQDMYFLRDPLKTMSSIKQAPNRSSYWGCLSLVWRWGMRLFRVGAVSDRNVWAIA
jgi:hypothetical protein